MTDQEILELPKVWVVGGDGGMGDIGYQNMSKVILQNRPNVKALMLDTQVYSNTGGQNSDSTPMLGGNDMNVFGTATQGKNIEKKTVAETFLAGHGSPFVAQVSMANAPKLYRAILDGLEYRGTAFLQCFTTCQPEHGVADDMALDQAQRVRDSRGAPEFVFNPRLGETYQEALDLKGNPVDRPATGTRPSSRPPARPYRYTVAHWCATEARFRNHLKKIKTEDGREADPARQHAGAHHAAGRRLSPLPRSRRTAPSFPTSASTSSARRTARSSTARSRASWCCSASSAARPGACCRARPASRTRNTSPRRPSSPTWTPARSPTKSSSPTPTNSWPKSWDKQHQPSRKRRTRVPHPCKGTARVPHNQQSATKNADPKVRL